MRKNGYPTDTPPGARGLRTKDGIIGLVLVLVPGALLIAVLIRKLTDDPLTGISPLNYGRGIGSCGICVFFGYQFLKSAWTGEYYRGQREKVLREEARELKQQQWQEGKKRRTHEDTPSRETRHESPAADAE